MPFVCTAAAVLVAVVGFGGVVTGLDCDFFPLAVDCARPPAAFADFFALALSTSLLLCRRLRCGAIAGCGLGCHDVFGCFPG